MVQQHGEILDYMCFVLFKQTSDYLNKLEVSSYVCVIVNGNEYKLGAADSITTWASRPDVGMLHLIEKSLTEIQRSS